MAKLILVRHGQTNWCKEERLRGVTDIPLNAEGKGEAEKIAARLSKFKIDAVYSSEASCSSQTAEEIAAPHNLKVKILGELKEINLGYWQGLLLKDIKKRYGKQYDVWMNSPVSAHPPGGESVRDAYDRAISAVQKLADQHKDETICVVSDDIMLSMIRCHLRNMNLETIWKRVPQKAWWESVRL